MSLPELSSGEWFAYGSAAAGLLIGAGSHVQTWLRRRREHRYGDPGIIRETSRKDAEIERLLTELRIRLEANRTLILRFRNGEKYYSGSPVQKVECAYESPDSQSRSIKDELGIVEASRMSGVIDRMFDDSPLVTNVTNMTDGYTRTIHKALGVANFMALPLKLYAQIEGCLLVHWNGTVQPTDAILSQKADEAVKQIERLLSDRLRITGKHP